MLMMVEYEIRGGISQCNQNSSGEITVQRLVLYVSTFP